jgi:inositol oxygenase
MEHALQTAEAIRADGHPPWFVVTGFIHDLGKMLCSFGEPQWAVVGDTFPVGCAFSPRIVYPELFADNPDVQVPDYRTRLGIYDEGCGLDRVHVSWGHDEYLYQVVRDRLPDEALYMIRYHSFHAAHREGAYDYLMNDRDRPMFEWVRAFSRYDLYSKSPAPPDRKALEPYYRELVEEFFPEPLRW